MFSTSALFEQSVTTWSCLRLRCILLLCPMAELFKPSLLHSQRTKRMQFKLTVRICSYEKQNVGSSINKLKAGSVSSSLNNWKTLRYFYTLLQSGPWLPKKWQGIYV